MTDTIEAPADARPTPRPRPTSARARCARRRAGSRSPPDATTDRWSGASAATATTCSARASSARRARRSSSCTRTPTGCGAPVIRRGDDRRPPPGRRSPGTRRSPRSSEASAPVLEAPRPRRGRRLPRQPDRPQPVGARSTAGPLLRALGTRNIYSASTVDQMPKHVSSGLLFGVRRHHPRPRPRPHRLPADARRQPVRVQRQPLHRAGLPRPARGHPRAGRHGSWWSTPAAPRRPTTADEHLFIRPGTDGHLLLGIIAVLFAEDLVDLGRPRRPHSTGVDERPRRSSTPFTPEAVAADHRHRRRHHPAPGPRARRRARPPRSTAASAPTPSRSARSASWAVDVVNVLTGNLDRPGGAMFPLAAHAAPTGLGAGPGLHHRPPAPAGSRATPRCAASSRSPPWPTRSRRPARARSGR